MSKFRVINIQTNTNSKVVIMRNIDDLTTHDVDTNETRRQMILGQQ